MLLYRGGDDNRTALPTAAIISVGIVVVVVDNIDVRRIKVEVVERVGQGSEYNVVGIQEGSRESVVRKGCWCRRREQGRA